MTKLEQKTPETFLSDIRQDLSYLSRLSEMKIISPADERHLRALRDYDHVLYLYKEYLKCGIIGDADAVMDQLAAFLEAALEKEYKLSEDNKCSKEFS